MQAMPGMSARRELETLSQYGLQIDLCVPSTDGGLRLKLSCLLRDLAWVSIAASAVLFCCPPTESLSQQSERPNRYAQKLGLRVFNHQECRDACPRLRCEPFSCTASPSLVSASSRMDLRCSPADAAAASAQAN
jgi:hypothetical protein